MLAVMGISKKPFKVKGRSAYHYKIDGRRKSLETSDHAEAARRLGELRKLFFKGTLRQLTGESPSKTIGSFVEEYEEWAEDVQPRDTFRANMLGIRKLEAVTGKMRQLSKVSLKDSDKLISAGLSAGNVPASVNNYLRHARTVLNKAVEWGYLKANPIAKAKMLPITKKPPVYIKAKEVPKFLASIEDIDKRRLVTGFIYSGRRRSELAALEWTDVNMEQEEYYIRRSKAHLERWYPMHPLFKATLLAIGAKDSGRVFYRWSHPDTISHIVKEALRGFGLGHLTLHKMRHTFATLLQDQGIDLATIGDLLGHTDKRATEIYAHVTDTRQRAAIRAIKGGPVEL